MQQQVHLGQQVGQGFGLPAVNAVILQRAKILGGLGLAAQMLIRFDQEAACPAGRIEHGFAQARIGDSHHEFDHGARCVEFAGIACRVTHFAQH